MNCLALNPITRTLCVLAPPHEGHRHWDRRIHWTYKDYPYTVPVPLEDAGTLRDYMPEG